MAIPAPDSAVPGKLLQEKVVLVIDDSPETLGFLNEALEQQGFSVLIALEGKQGLSIARKMAPDMILLDAIMPNMDGFETCRALKADPRLANIPVMFMTGLSDTESVVKGLDAGGVDYLNKPINPDELLARMRVHLSNARLASSAHSALDTTGQYLLTIDGNGRILWATPQVRQLFAHAKVAEQWLEEDLGAQLTSWLAHQPLPGQTFHLQGLEHPLDVRLVTSDGHETLLKLVDGLAPSGPAKLQEALPLTERESEVLYWIGNGKTNREIGQILDASPRTVNKHLEQIFRKLEVDNRTLAAAKAIRILVAD